MKVLHGEQRQGDQTDLVTHKAQALPSPQQSEPGAKPPPTPRILLRGPDRHW